ncbi:exopolysaccharide biosynthesis polyprenyl glycosylphosphotransferase [uncultured Sphingomonas sp.]|uniref:exopolysaccharide biosynthesis polyprenyl glycosylphosphotransferase n=1 Tax=uncultured Sphingomonas sp. TaxID=158754 RepID=UPI0035CB050A
MTAHMLIKSDAEAPLIARGVDTQVIRALIYGGLAAADLLIVLGAFVGADLLRHSRLNDTLSHSYLLIVPVFMAVSLYSGCYTYGAVVSRSRSIPKVVGAFLAASGFTLVLIFALKNSGYLSRLAFFVGALFSLAGLVAVRMLVPQIIRRLGPRFFRRVLITDGGWSEAIPVGFERVDADGLGLRPELADPLMLHRFSQIVAGADRVVVACPVEHRERWSLYLKSVDCAGELLVPELHNVEPLGQDGVTGLAGVRVSVGRLDLRNRILKRCFDLAITAPVLVLLSPVMLLAAIAIKLESPGPVLFRQQRMGRANQLFDVFKFRSMYVDQGDQDGAQSTARGDQRITRVGRWIRATSIDELPQLFNVINGDMSLVGPRPHALGSRAGDELFWHVDRRYWLRHTIKPGLTGLAQVRGHRGATEVRADLTKRLESDIEYLSHWSVLSDIAILVRTAFVLVHRNAY